MPPGVNCFRNEEKSVKCGGYSFCERRGLLEEGGKGRERSERKEEKEEER